MRKLVQSREDMRGNYVLRLGELPVVFAIGNFIDSSGINEAWSQNGVFGTVVIRQVISCSNMKRDLIAHLITLTVLYCLYFEAMLECNPNQFIRSDESVIKLVYSLLA